MVYLINSFKNGTGYYCTVEADSEAEALEDFRQQDPHNFNGVVDAQKHYGEPDYCEFNPKRQQLFTLNSRMDNGINRIVPWSGQVPLFKYCPHLKAQ